MNRATVTILILLFISFAASPAQESTARLLKACGFPIDPNGIRSAVSAKADLNVLVNPYPDGSRWKGTCLHRLVLEDKVNADLVRLLLENGADANVRSSDGSIALDSLVSIRNMMKGRPDLVDLLLEKGAQPDLRDGDGTTPLMRAAEAGRPIETNLLIQRGADVNAQDNKGFSVLMYAARFDYCRPGTCGPSEPGLDQYQQSEQTVNLLLDHGAKIDAKNKAGDTVLDLLKDGGRNGFIVELLEARSKKSAK